jgi:hypothetical protein
VNSRAGLDNVEKRKFFTLPGLELRPLGRPARIHTDYAIQAPLRSPCRTVKCEEDATFLQPLLSRVPQVRAVYTEVFLVVQSLSRENWKL